MTPLREMLLSSAQPSNYVVSVLEGLFELTRRPFSGPWFPLCVAFGTTENAKCAELGTEVPGHCQKTTDANLDFPFVDKTHFFELILECKKLIELMTRPE